MELNIDDEWSEFLLTPKTECLNRTIELPENVEKLVTFMNETGGTVEDYVELNRDYSKFDDNQLLSLFLAN